MNFIVRYIVFTLWIKFELKEWWFCDYLTCSKYRLPGCVEKPDIKRHHCLVKKKKTQKGSDDGVGLKSIIIEHSESLVLICTTLFVRVLTIDPI